MKAVAYYRVSTSRQGSSGLGLEAQRTAVADFVSSKGGEIVAAFTEIMSGKEAQRVELDRAIETCRREDATLVIAKLDRLARRVSFIANLMETGIDFRVAEMPNAEPFMLHIYAAVAEEEGRQISRRTKAALAAAKARGVQLGNPRPDKSLRAAREKASEKAEEARKAILPEIYAVKASGATSLRQIARKLNERGVTTPRGRQWHAASVRNILQKTA